ncbi:hypothetical protein ACIQUZ_01100 [Streptomyces griseus]|uniref:hypothetical protein n=1 Tax=Streptomyces griseus TaxID=1911 RepID=UPI0038129A9D
MPVKLADVRLDRRTRSRDLVEPAEVLARADIRAQPATNLTQCLVHHVGYRLDLTFQHLMNRVMQAQAEPWRSGRREVLELLTPRLSVRS